MLKLLVTLVLSFSLIGCNATTPSSTSFQELAKQVHQISNEYGNGSGVMIAPGLMLTNAHVVDLPDLRVNGKPIKILKVSTEFDLALIEVEQGCPCALIGALPEPYEKVYNVGYPFGFPFAIITDGIFQGLIKDKFRIVVTAQAGPGSSGGGTFVYAFGKWQLVGLVSEMTAARGPWIMPIPVFYMIRSVDINTIKEFLEQ